MIVSREPETGRGVWWRTCLVDQVIPPVPVRQWVASLPIPLRVLLAAQPELVTPALQVVQRVVTRRSVGFPYS